MKVPKWLPKTQISIVVHQKCKKMQKQNKTIKQTNKQTNKQTKEQVKNINMKKTILLSSVSFF